MIRTATPQIELRNLHRVFDQTHAVNDVSFEVQAGEVFGYIGPNGAGKTTSMRILATLDEPTAGDAFVDGFSVTEDPDRAYGLQVEVDPRNNSGGIYESYRRAWVDKPEAEEQAKYFKKDDWNDVEISAYGGDVKVTVNGYTTADLKDDPSRPAGHWCRDASA